MGLRLKKSNVESAEKNNHMTDTQEFPSDRQIQHDLAMRSSMLHSYCGNGTSFDARCCLLFHDWYWPSHETADSILRCQRMGDIS